MTEIATKKLLFVTTHFAPDFHFGGVVESGTRLFKNLKKISEINLVAVSKSPTKKEIFLDNNDKIFKSLLFHGWGFSFSLILGLYQEIKKKPDIVLINGIATFPTTLASFYCTILKVPFVVATRGGLEPWRRKKKKIRKWFYFELITLPLIRKAKYIHVTAANERQTLENLRYENCIEVSNGIDLEMYMNLPNNIDTKINEKKYRLLFFSRMDVEKGLDILISAFSRFSKEKGNERYQLILAGPDDKNYLHHLNINNSYSNIIYVGAVYGTEKLKLYRSADMLILPSYSENFGNVIAESLACAVPVITTYATPWIMLEEIKCGILIQPNEEEVYKALKTYSNLSSTQLINMGNKGREYIIKNFNWEEKAKELLKFLQ